MHDVKVERKENSIGCLGSSITIYLSGLFLIIGYGYMLVHVYNLIFDIEFAPEHKLLTLKLNSSEEDASKIRLFHISQQNMFASFKITPVQSANSKDKITITPILKDSNKKIISNFQQIEINNNPVISINSLSNLNHVDSPYIDIETKNGAFSNASLDVIFTLFSEQTFFDISGFMTISHAAVCTFVFIFLIQYYFAPKNYESLFSFIAILIVCIHESLTNVITNQYLKGILSSLIGVFFRHFLIVLALSKSTKKHFVFSGVILFIALAIPKIFVDIIMNFNYYNLTFPLPPLGIVLNIVSMCLIMVHITVGIIYILLEILQTTSIRKATLIVILIITVIPIDFEIQIHIMRLLGYVDPSGLRFPYYSIFSNTADILTILLLGIIITSPTALIIGSPKEDTVAILSEADFE